MPVKIPTLQAERLQLQHKPTSASLLYPSFLDTSCGLLTEKQKCSSILDDDVTNAVKAMTGINVDSSLQGNQKERNISVARICRSSKHIASLFIFPANRSESESSGSSCKNATFDTLPHLHSYNSLLFNVHIFCYILLPVLYVYALTCPYCRYLTYSVYTIFISYVQLFI